MVQRKESRGGLNDVVEAKLHSQFQICQVPNLPIMTFASDVRKSTDPHNRKEWFDTFTHQIILMQWLFF